MVPDPKNTNKKAFRSAVDTMLRRGPLMAVGSILKFNVTTTYGVTCAAFATPCMFARCAEGQRGLGQQTYRSSSAKGCEQRDHGNQTVLRVSGPVISNLAMPKKAPKKQDADKLKKKLQKKQCA
eukprot:3672251-Amphidinium_carterae.2